MFVVVAAVAARSSPRLTVVWLLAFVFIVFLSLHNFPVWLTRSLSGLWAICPAWAHYLLLSYAAVSCKWSWWTNICENANNWFWFLNACFDLPKTSHTHNTHTCLLTHTRTFTHTHTLTHTHLHPPTHALKVRTKRTHQRRNKIPILWTGHIEVQSSSGLHSSQR